MLVRTMPLGGGSPVSAPEPLPESIPGPEPSPGPTSPVEPLARVEPELPCQQADDADLWFADTPGELERAKAQCAGCPIRIQCLEGALRREEPWGVWGGEIFQRGSVVARKRPRGRPSKAALARDRELAEAGAPL